MPPNLSCEQRRADAWFHRDFFVRAEKTDERNEHTGDEPANASLLEWVIKRRALWRSGLWNVSH